MEVRVLSIANDLTCVKVAKSLHSVRDMFRTPQVKTLIPRFGKEMHGHHPNPYGNKRKKQRKLSEETVIFVEAPGYDSLFVYK